MTPDPKQVNLDPTVWGAVFPDLIKPRDRQARPILGFRINRVEVFPGRGGKASVNLYSLGRGALWEPGRNQAVCLASGLPQFQGPRHSAPASGCTCGLYAVHELGPLQGMSNFLSGWFVVAGIAGSGTVCIHSRGWRAQYARIVALSVDLPAVTGLGAVEPPTAPTSPLKAWLRRFFGLETRLYSSYGQRSAPRNAAFRGVLDLTPQVPFPSMAIPALEAKYQVPVVPLQQLKAVMAHAGDFWEDMQ